MIVAESICGICDGTGWKIVERAGLSGAERCECYASRRAESIKENAGIPSNYAHATLRTFALPSDNPVSRAYLSQVLSLVSGYAREFPNVDPPGLLLVGDTGTGKTHLAIGALKAIIEKEFEGLFFDYQNLLDRIRAGFDIASGSSDREAYRSALDAEVLLLDDLGACRAMDWVEDTVASIITYRCNHRKPLIATTNLPDDAVTGPIPLYKDASGQPVNKKTLAETIGLRARSRLFEMCRVVKMPAVGDYRISTRATR